MFFFINDLARSSKVVISTLLLGLGLAPAAFINSTSPPAMVFTNVSGSVRNVNGRSLGPVTVIATCNSGTWFRSSRPRSRPFRTAA